MNMIQMKYFITAAKCLNFTKAADKLFIMPGTESSDCFHGSRTEYAAVYPK